MTSKFDNPVFCAFDTPDVEAATSLSAELQGSIGGIKMGMEFFYSKGAEGYRKVASAGCPIFLDLKLHDIPNTVAKGIGSLLSLEPTIMTIHTQGGPNMMAAAAKAADEATGLGFRRPNIVGVTILTSLDQGDINTMGISGEVKDQVARLGRLAKAAGLDGCVCSPFEIEILREVCGEDFLLVVPGIRPSGSAVGDQKRVMGPKEAISAGADILVIGRPITGAENPQLAAKNILEEIRG